MNRYSIWRYALIFILLLIGIIYSLPNLYGRAPAISISRGDDDSIAPSLASQIKQSLLSQKIAISKLDQDAHQITLQFKDVEDQLHAQDIVEKTLGAQYNVALNLASKSPRWLESIGAEPMSLGLDLRGGIHFLMYVDTNSALKNRLTNDMRDMTAKLREKQIRYKGTTVSANTMSVRFTKKSDVTTSKNVLQGLYPQYRFIEFAQKGFHYLKVIMPPSSVSAFEMATMDKTMTILRNRVNQIGVSEPIVQQQGKNYINIDLPGIQDAARAKKLIGTAATVQMQLVAQGNPDVAYQTGVVPFGTKLYQTRDGRPVLLKEDIALSGAAIVNAGAQIGQDGRPSVIIDTSGPEVSEFYQLTGANIGKALAVLYIETDTTVSSGAGGAKQVQSKQKAHVISVATIQSALGNRFNITGLVSMREATNLAVLLRSGAYPVAPAFVEEQIVGPSMGKENIEKGEMSTAVGFLLVVIFMLLYYRFFGLVADLALFVNLVFIVAIMSLLHATLTLPGIAGIVLTIGMAVDANVLINERIREELRLGMTPQAAISAGYGRAFSTIVDANVTTLIVAVILFSIGSGPVKNFAITLIIGLLTSMVSAIFFTRAIVNLVYGYRHKLKHLSIGIRVQSSKE